MLAVSSAALASSVALASQTGTVAHQPQPQPPATSLCRLSHTVTSGCKAAVCVKMLIRSLLSRRVHSQRYLSSGTPHVLKPGDVLRQTRIFTDDDVLQYSKVSHDSNPLHFDSDSARNAGFEGRLVHGMLVASLFPQIISSHFPGAVYVSQSLSFKFPVYIGDQINGEVQTTSLRENRNRYLAKFKTRCFKNGELLVLEGEAVAMLPTLDVDSGRSKS